MAHFVDRFGRKRVGLARPSFTAGLTFGMVRGPLLAAAIQRHVTSGELLEWARREPFRGGRVFRLLAVGWPRWLSQPSVFIAMREQQALVTGAPLQRVFTEPRPGMLLSSPLTQNL